MMTRRVKHEIQSSQTHIPRSGAAEDDMTRNHTTMWEEFLAFRHQNNHQVAHQLVCRLAIEWVFYAGAVQYVIYQDPPLAALFAPTVTVKSLMIACFAMSAYLTWSKRWINEYSRPLTLVLGVFTFLHLVEGALSNFAISSEGGSLEATDWGIKVTHQSLGAHQLLFTLVILANSRLILQTPKNHLYLLVPIVLGQLATLGNSKPVVRTDSMRALAAVLIIGISNVYGSHLWIQSEWVMFVQRKRLRFACMRSEELLTLAMPRNVAHELMVGSIQSKYYEHASLAFLYIPDYDQQLSNSLIVHETAADILTFMGAVHRLYCQLDELVFSHPNVYKVESVGDCYMVASGIPNIIRDLLVQHYIKHGEALVTFCIEAMELCCAFENSDPFRIIEHRDLKLSREAIQPWKLQAGIHSGAVSTGCCGKTRTFYRVFGDSVNMAARVASKASPGEILCSESFYKLSLNSPPLGQSVTLGDCAVPFMPLTFKEFFLKGKGNHTCYSLASAQETSCFESQNDNTIGGQTPPTSRKGKKGSWKKQYETSLTGSQRVDKEELHSNRLERAQRAVQEISDVLNTPMDAAVESYKQYKSDITPNAGNYYINHLEKSYLQKFVEKFFANDVGQNHLHASTQKWFERSAIEYAFNHLDGYCPSPWYGQRKKASTTSTTKLNFALAIRGAKSRPSVLPFEVVRSNFADPQLERTFQQSLEGVMYGIAQQAFGWILLILISSIGYYTNALQEESWLFVFYCLSVGTVTTIVHRMFKRFIRLHKVDLFSDSFSAVNLEIRNDSPTTPSRKYDAGEHTTSSISDHEVSRFSSWMSGIACLTIALVSYIDHMVLLQLRAVYTQEQLCLHAFIAPLVLLSVFQWFNTKMVSQLLFQATSVILIFAVFLISGIFGECQSLLFWLGVYAVACTAYNGVITSRLQELNFRQSFVLQFAATHAKQQSDIALRHLFPEPVVVKLERDVQVPFTRHPEDLVVLQSDLVGFTEICSHLSPKTVRLLLDNLFSQFDDIVSEEKLWKMDTIGDAYLVVGGLVDQVDKRYMVGRFFSLARKMINIVKEFKTFTRHNEGIRIAIHAGPAASGVLGRLRPRFYVFGRTMYEAAILERTGEKNKIHVSEKAAHLYRQNHFGFQRGSSEESYFLEDDEWTGNQKL